jgi:hypothetical protein
LDNFGQIILVVVVVVAVTAILTWFQARKKGLVWQGTVTQIKHKMVDRNRNEEGSAELEEFVAVYYRTDNGKKGKLSFRAREFNQLFPDLKIDDRLDKQAGEYNPKKA